MIVDQSENYKANMWWRTICSLTKRERLVYNSLVSYQIKTKLLLIIRLPSINKCQLPSQTIFIQTFTMANLSSIILKAICSSYQSYPMLNMGLLVTTLLIKRNLYKCSSSNYIWTHNSTLTSSLKSPKTMLSFKNIKPNNMAKA